MREKMSLKRRREEEEGEEVEGGRWKVEGACPKGHSQSGNNVCIHWKLPPEVSSGSTSRLKKSLFLVNIICLRDIDPPAFWSPLAKSSPQQKPDHSESRKRYSEGYI